MDTSPSHTDAAKRPRGDKSLRAEQRHRAEGAAAELTEILTPAVPDVFITTSAVVGSVGASAASSPDAALAPHPTPPPIDDATEIEPPWVSEAALPVASPPAASLPVAKPAVANPPIAKPAVANPPIAKPAVANPPVAKPAVASPPVANLLVVKPAVASLPVASLPVASLPVRVPLAPTSAGQQLARVAPALVPGAMFATVAGVLLFGIASSLWPSGKTGALADPPATEAAAPASSLPVASTPAAALDRSTVPASQVPTDHPTGTIGLANQARQPVVRSPQPDAHAVTPVPTASEGQLRVTSTPSGARVTVNGIGWGQTPLTVGHLPLGTKTVRLTRDGYASQQRVVELRGDDASAALNVALQRAR